MKWETQPIKNIYVGLYDGPHATPPISDSGAIFLGISNITEDGRLDFSDIKYISEEDLPRWTKRVVPCGGDIAFSYEATLNRYAIIPEDFYGCLGRRMALIRPNEEKVLGKFLYYYFFSDTWRSTISENTVMGATVDRIPLINFPDFPVSFPELREQEKIVAVLSAYDDLIENNQKQIKLLEEAAHRLYKEWFIDLRFPGYETMPVHDGVPDGWEKTSIDSRITLYSGFAFKSADFTDKGQYRIVTIKNVKDAQFIGDNVSYMKEIPPQMPVYCKLADGDILLSLTGNVGRVCLVHGKDYLLNQRVAKLQSSFPGFTYCLFRSKDMFDSMNNLANGAAQQNLSPIRTGKLEALFPCPETAQQFENIVGPMLQKIVLLNKEIVSAAQSRDRLLPKLMSGEIEV